MPSFPSFTTIVSLAFLAYMGNSLYTIGQLFLPPDCNPAISPALSCLTSQLKDVPHRRFMLFTTTNHKPNTNKDLKFVGDLDVEDPMAKIEKNMNVTLSTRVRNNGTMYLAVFSTPYNSAETPNKHWLNMISGKDVTYTFIPLTQHKVADEETFNLLGVGGEKDSAKDEKMETVRSERPVTHLRTKVTLSIMNDHVNMPVKEIPAELYYLMRKTDDRKKYLPIVYVDELSLRLRDLVVVNSTDQETEVEFVYQPISYGKLRLFLQFTTALSSMHQLGFTAKDTDEVKGIFADTNMVLLLVTFGVSAVHLLFDFLAFKNEISFWRSKKTMEGLSTTTVLWRAFSQTVIFFYLMDENTSLLVLIPSGFAALIEMWKVKKAFKVKISTRGFSMDKSSTETEKSTVAYDSESMRYLSYVLYPLCFGGAVYSLVYTPHKSWWSWTIQSVVNGVYAFGFLFMLPQLFVNYKLKSVAHLPWRAFMYKAFNTFIDDLFAFIITMPTAHRVACFRDDIVFLIYLYQRYLYPVDKSRIDPSSGMMEETTTDSSSPAPTAKEKKEN